MVRPAFRHIELLDDLAMDIHAYLIEISTEYEGHRFVAVPITEMVNRFERNHRTIQRRIDALRHDGLLVQLIKKNAMTLYAVREQEDQS